MTEYQIIKEKGGYRVWEHTRVENLWLGTDIHTPLEPLYEEYYQAAMARVDLYRKLPAAEGRMTDREARYYCRHKCPDAWGCFNQFDTECVGDQIRAAQERQEGLRKVGSALIWIADYVLAFIIAMFVCFFI